MQFIRNTVLLCCFFFWKDSEAVVNSARNFVKTYHSDFTIHKVSLTQKGYIQFLKYIRHVPPLNDYTFCIWVKSINLTYAHPLLSYSKNEEERLIRVWLSPHGTNINLEILEQPIFKIQLDFVEHYWYHICQSWSSYQGSWNFFLNGKLKSSGTQPLLRGITIKGGGDIVVGQEYTDFDKGLDDGIEGDIFGFNFVLSSTTPTSKFYFPSRRHYDLTPTIRSQPVNDINYNLGYFSQEPNRKLKPFGDIFDTMFTFIDTPNTRRVLHRSKYGNDIEDNTPKSVGLKLVELGYKCFFKKGAPISGKDVLISWTKTPVRVFGGATLKNISPFCV